MFEKVALTVSAVAFIMLAIALAPNVPTALATVRGLSATQNRAPRRQNIPAPHSNFVS